METINVEVILKNHRSLNDNKVTSICDSYLKSRTVRPGTVISTFDPKENLYLYETVDHIIIGEHGNFKCSVVNFFEVHIKWFLYVLDKNELQIESDYDENGENVELATLRMLPSIEYFNLWENLIYDISVKEELLRFAHTALLFADRKINCNVISCNRVVLLHGPPGTGKTSLCKALAHKLTVRLQNRFKRGFLLEINSHSLFSKWFSESGKLVTKMFSKITEFLKDPEAIIFVLIDEVESLAHAREKCMTGAEPSDSIRVVNAVLTQIDQIKNHPNVLILTTSNVTDAIDLAFVDRADIKQFIGLPSPEAVYQIYYSCIQELMKSQIINPSVVIPPIHVYNNPEYKESNLLDYSKNLYDISKLSVGLSGRTLRKIPFLAHALFSYSETLNINEFFKAMVKAVERQHNSTNIFCSKKEINI